MTTFHLKFKEPIDIEDDKIYDTIVKSIFDDIKNKNIVDIDSNTFYIVKINIYGEYSLIYSIFTKNVKEVVEMLHDNTHSEQFIRVVLNMISLNSNYNFISSYENRKKTTFSCLKSPLEDFNINDYVIKKRNNVKITNCAHCNKEIFKILKCSGCQKAYYCGAECQREHWYTGGHNKVC